MGDKRRPFDIKPTVFIVMFSVALAGGLIAVNTQSSSESLETSQTRTVEDGAERVARQVGEQQPGRQIISPSLSSDTVSFIDADVEDDVSIEVASATEVADDSEQDSASDVVDVAAPLTTSAPATTAAPGPQPATTTTVTPPTTRASATTQAPATTRPPRATTTTTIRALSLIHI